jgi:sterol desaturase/sphingolipid hydroxylase (fatty acid hydroxylase superfamily)
VAADPDPLVEEMMRARRSRRPLVIAVSIGIVIGVALAMAMFLGALGGEEPRDHSRNRAAMAFFVAPLVFTAIAYAIHRWRGRRR